MTDDTGTRRLASETTPGDLGVTDEAGIEERVEAAIERSIPMVEAGDSPMLAASWCADVLGIPHGRVGDIQAGIEQEVGDDA